MKYGNLDLYDGCMLFTECQEAELFFVQENLKNVLT